MTRLQILKSTAFSLIFAAAFGAVAATDARAQSAPAVSAINGKAAVGGGAFDDEAFGFAEGSFTLPLSQNFGFQADGVVGAADDGEFYGGAGHLFWRDPSVGLLGLYGGVTHVDISRAFTQYIIAGEGEVYLDQVSIETLIGYGLGERVDDDVVALGNVAFYATDDFRIFGGARYLAEDLHGAAGTEYQISASSGASLFAEGRYHDSDRWQAFAGVRFYFGSPKSLIRRHREDDPGAYGIDFLVQPETRRRRVEEERVREFPEDLDEELILD